MEVKGKRSVEKWERIGSADFVTFGSFGGSKIVVALEANPQLGRSLEVAAKADCDFCADAPLCVDDFVQAHWVSMRTSLGLI